MNRKRRTQEERRRETREQILAAASRVFARLGFHATSLDAIGEEAGFSRGAVYYNFADKEELFLELLDRRCAERAQDLREIFIGNGDDVAATGEQTDLAARRALDAMTGDREWLALYMEFLAHAARDDDFRHAFARRTDEMRAALDQIVAERSLPVIDALPMTPAQLGATIDALGVGLASHHMLHGDDAVPPDLLGKAISLMVDGILARSRAQPTTGGPDDSH